MKKMIMRSLPVAVVLVAAAMGPASAADMYGGGASLKNEPVYAPAPIWEGYYIGGHIGALWSDGASVKGAKQWCGDVNECQDWEKFESSYYGDTTLLGGIHAGYNWQSGAKVIGIEGDVSFGGGLDYLASLRGRLGLANGNLLVYMTGGVAFAGFDSQDAWDFKGGDDRRIGFVVGGGAEYKLRPNVSIGVEGLYYAFGDSSKTLHEKSYSGHESTEYLLTREGDNDLVVVRGRLTYHFQDEQAVPLK